MKKIIYLLLPLSLAFAACNSNNEPTKPETATASAETEEKPALEKPTSSEVEKLDSDYPEAFRTAQLPMWENATVEKANRIENERGVRYQVSLSSNEDVQTTANYYSKTMKEAGWQMQNIASNTATTMDRRSLRFTKDGLQTMINIVDLPKQEKRIITIVFSDRT